MVKGVKMDESEDPGEPTEATEDAVTEPADNLVDSAAKATHEAPPIAQEPPVRVTPYKPIAAPYFCKWHDTYFPDENPWRPIWDWEHNTASKVPLRSCCKHCDAAHKAEYARRKRATSGGDLLASVQATLFRREKDLAEMIADGDGGTVVAQDIAEHIEYLKAQERRLLAGGTA